MDNRYDLERLVTFINSVTSPKRRAEMTPEQISASEYAAAEALMDLLSGFCDVRAKLGLKRKKGQRTKVNDPSTVVMDDDRFTIVYRYVSGEISYEEAVKQMAELIHMSESTAKRMIKGIKPNAESAYQLLQLCQSRAQGSVVNLGSKDR
jgi:hypothetical protein